MFRHPLASVKGLALKHHAALLADTCGRAVADASRNVTSCVVMQDDEEESPQQKGGGLLGGLLGGRSKSSPDASTSPQKQKKTDSKPSGAKSTGKEVCMVDATAHRGRQPLPP